MSEDNNIKLSVIVPIYNVEKYLEKCLDSLVNQELKTVEYLLINDGSTDGSVSIAEKFVHKDPRFKLYSKTNGGLSSARNYGMKYAVGEYVYFVDSDDFLEQNVLGKMVELAEENQLDVLKVRSQNIKETIIQVSTDGLDQIYGKVLTGREYVITKAFPYSVWHYMCRRNFLNDNGLEFLEGVYHEDMEFTPRMLYYADKVMLTDLIAYNYNIREGSISTTNDSKRVTDYYRIASEINEWVEENVDLEMRKNFFDEYVEFLYAHPIRLCYEFHIKYSYILDNSETRNEILKHLKKSKKLIYRMLFLLIVCRYLWRIEC